MPRPTDDPAATTAPKTPAMDAGDVQGVLPPEEARALSYPMLENGATLGTVCEYEKDNWTWVIITDLDEKPACEYDCLDFDTDEPLVRFLILDELTDSEFAMFEDAVGCYEHVDTARMFTDHDGAGRHTPRSYFVEAFRPLGPFHPKHPDRGEYDVDF